MDAAAKLNSLSGKCEQWAGTGLPGKLWTEVIAELGAISRTAS